MVQVRKLRPLVEIRMPGASTPVYARRVPIRVVRRRSEFPPPTPQPTPCVLWQGIVDRQGYGRLKVEVDGRLVPTGPHRWVMDLINVAETGVHLRPDQVVLHRCDNPPCFRVDHLVVGTVRENNADMFAKGRASPPPVNVFYGQDHPRAKLSDAEVAALRDESRAGMSSVSLAARYGVHPATVRKILSGSRRSRPGDDRPRQFKLRKTRGGC